MRLARAFVRVGLLDDSTSSGRHNYSYLPGAGLSVKEAVSVGWCVCVCLFGGAGGGVIVAL